MAKGTTLQLSGLSKNLTEAALTNMYRTYGPILRIKRDEQNGAHVVFAKQQNANKAAQATNGAVVDGKQLSVAVVPTFKKAVRPCRGFLAGRCTMGDACKYYHMPQNQSAVPAAAAIAATPTPAAAPQAQVQAPAQPQAQVQAPAQPQSLVVDQIQGIPSSVVCRHFARGYCSVGAACRFAHVLGGPASKGPETDVSAQKKRPCLFFASGVCTRGDHCLFSHDVKVSPAPAVASPAAPKAKTKAKTKTKTKAKTQAVAKVESAAFGSDGEQDEDSRRCLECEKPGVATWQCAKCDGALYCDGCNVEVHRARVMGKHKRTKLPPVPKKPQLPRCGECEKRDASLQCEQCEVPYCASCDAAVHKFKSLRSHVRVAVTAATTATTTTTTTTTVTAKPTPVLKAETKQKEKKPVVSAPVAAPAAPVAAKTKSKSPVKYEESVPQLDFSSDDSSSDEAEDEDEEEEEDEDEDEEEEEEVVRAMVSAAPVLTHPAEVSSESESDDDEPMRPSPASAAQPSPVVAKPVAVQEDASDSSDDDFDDVKPASSASTSTTSKSTASSTKSSKSSKSSSQSESESESESSEAESESESEDDTPTPPPTAARRAPAASTSSTSNQPTGISTGSSHSVVKKIEAFHESGEGQELHLDANLNGFERLLAHDCAERLGLAHESSGSGLERHITISRRSGAGNKRAASATSSHAAKKRNKQY